MDATRVDRLLTEGRLPNLAALRARGAVGSIVQRPDLMRTRVWPSFQTGLGAHERGNPLSRDWSPARMRLDGGAVHARLEPFWEQLPPDMRAIVADVPFARPPTRPMPLTLLAGWQSIPDMIRGARPATLEGEIVRRFGPRVQTGERRGSQTVEGLLGLHREMVAATEQIGAIGAWLAAQPFELMALVIGTTHRSGHYLWDDSQAVDRERMTSVERDRLAGALDDVYVAADAALGRILDTAPAGARVLAFALHGMKRSDGWAERFGGIVALLRGEAGAAAQGRGLAHRLKQALPAATVRQVTSRLPKAVGDWLAARASHGSCDWSRTGFFELPGDVDCYLRLNLRGREALGIVEPGPEADALCDELTGELLGLRDLETGEPVVERVDRVDDLVPAGAARRGQLADLVVRWAGRDAVDSIGVRTAGGRERRWPRHARLASGRSGGHVPGGWLVAAGPGIAAGRLNSALAPQDLSATAIHWLEAVPRGPFEGRPMDLPAVPLRQPPDPVQRSA
jgi:predicted AlkP superfamily phosphohydrolase/phosphomutase